MWLNVVGVIARTEDSDYAPRPYPLLAEGKRPVESRSAPVAFARVEAAPQPAVAVPLPPSPAVAAPPVQAAVVVTASAKSGAGSVLSAAAAPLGDEGRGGGRRGKLRSRRSLRRRISLVVSLGILVGGGWLIVRDVFLRPTWPQISSGGREASPVAAVDAGSGESGGGASQTTVTGLELAAAGNSWDMPAAAWSSGPTPGAATASSVGGGEGVVVTPLAESAGPAPSKEFLDYAATLKITVVARGERVRATINGIAYMEGDIVEHGMGVRLAGRDMQERALIFEDANRARVKVNY